MRLEILEKLNLDNIKISIGKEVLGNTGKEEILKLESSGIEIAIYDHLPDQEILQFILQAFERNVPTDLILSELLSASNFETLIRKFEEIGENYGIESVWYVEDKRSVSAGENVFVLPIESATSGYLGSFIFVGRIDPVFVLAILSMKDTITSIAEGMILSRRMKELLKSAIEALSSALESRVKEGKRKKEFRERLAIEMNERLNFDEDLLKLALMVYDVGKIGVPDSITSKSPDELTEEEFEIFKKHVEYGYEILSGIKDLPKEVLDATLYHHERFDGSGYPKGLKGDQVPPFAYFIGFLDEVSHLVIEKNLDRETILERMRGRFPDEILKSFEVVSW